MEGTKYKPFDLEKAKQGAKVMTRDGKPARIICTDRKPLYDGYNIIALVANEDGVEFTYTYMNDGKCYNGADSNHDLVMCPEESDSKTIALTKEDADAISEAIGFVWGYSYCDEEDMRKRLLKLVNSLAKIREKYDKQFEEA